MGNLGLCHLFEPEKKTMKKKELPRTRKQSSGAVVFRFQEGKPVYLLLRAYRNWDFPKGLLEGQEDPLEAALREIREETELVHLLFPFGPIYRETEPYAGGKVARFYLVYAPQGEVRLLPSKELGRPEHHEFRWADYESARGLLVPRLQAVLDWAHETIQRKGFGSQGDSSPLC
jgi:bis(5'-nucleosidyl)-tetraphosphatase